MPARIAASEPAAGTAEREISATRVFDAPRDLVWKMWTDRNHIINWWGPNGFTNTIHEMDVRPGGVWSLVMHGPDGRDYQNRFVYREIVKPERLVFVISFSDENRGVTRHPMAPVWPLVWLPTITFDAKGDQTTVTVHWTPLNATEEERKAFDAGQASMNQGWSGTFEQLEQYLAKLVA